jgi:hypothetical protein
LSIFLILTRKLVDLTNFQYYYNAANGQKHRDTGTGSYLKVN